MPGAIRSALWTNRLGEGSWDHRTREMAALVLQKFLDLGEQLHRLIPRAHEKAVLTPEPYPLRVSCALFTITVNNAGERRSETQVSHSTRTYILNSMLDTVNIWNFYLSVIKKNMKGSYYPNPKCLKTAKGLIETWYLGWIQKFREGSRERWVSLRDRQEAIGG